MLKNKNQITLKDEMINITKPLKEIIVLQEKIGTISQLKTVIQSSPLHFKFGFKFYNYYDVIFEYENEGIQIQLKAIWNLKINALEMAADTIYYGCDGFDGIEGADGFKIEEIPQEITMLSHFNSKATDGLAKEYVDKYTKAYKDAPLNQFGASAYDCVYALYGAMQKAIDAGKKIPVTISASDLCDILKEQFENGYTIENAVTGDSITWESTGYVNKTAIQYVIKEANQ